MLYVEFATIILFLMLFHYAGDSRCNYVYSVFLSSSLFMGCGLTNVFVFIFENIWNLHRCRRQWISFVHPFHPANEIVLNVWHFLYDCLLTYQLNEWFLQVGAIDFTNSYLNYIFEFVNQRGELYFIICNEISAESFRNNNWSDRN